MQILANALVSASVYCLAALAFAVRLNSARFFDFSIGLLFTLAAYVALLTRQMFEFDLAVAGLAGVVASGILGAFLEWSVFAQLRRRGGTDLLALLASLGLYIAGQNAISLYFGDGREALNTGGRNVGLLLLGARVTEVQVAIGAIAVGVVLSFLGFLRWTRAGLHVRAISVNAELGEIVGLRVDTIRMVAGFVAGVVAGIGGVLYSIDVDLIPSMGLPVLVAAVVIVVFGGQGAPLGIGIGAVTLATAQHATAWYISAKWMEAVPLVIVLAFLIIRPQGLAGRLQTGIRTNI